MKKRSKWILFPLAVCVAVLVWSSVEIHAVGNHLQYLIPAPVIATGDTKQDSTQAGQADDTQAPAVEVQPNAQVFALWESLQTTAGDWNGIIQNFTLSGIVQSMTLASDAGETKQARLNALGPDAFALVPQYLRVGRLFYPEELANGSSGILLDEQLALALFRVAEPIGRTVTISDVVFTVIGVLRHEKHVGDSEDYAAYVSLAALWDQAMQLDALQVTAQPVSGAGARATFKADLENWKAGGSLIDLGKEGMGALLPLRVLLFFCASVLFFSLLRYWNGHMRKFIADTRERLTVEYTAKLMPRLTTGALALVLGYGLLVLAAAVLINYIVTPVYTFPEWVPAVLVEWKDIQTAFWQVWQGAADLMELRSPEVIRIRYFGMLTGWFSAGAAVVLTSLWVRWRGRVRENNRQ